MVQTLLHYYLVILLIHKQTPPVVRQVPVTGKSATDTLFTFALLADPLINGTDLYNMSLC